MNLNMNESTSELLYRQSSQLRAMARMFSGNGDTERPEIAFDAVECDGLAMALKEIADGIDAVRDM